MDFNIKVYRSLNDELKEYWQSLEQESYGYCFQSYDWFENWANTFRINNNKYSLCIVAVLSKSKISAPSTSFSFLRWVISTDSEVKAVPAARKLSKFFEELALPLSSFFSAKAGFW